MIERGKNMKKEKYEQDTWDIARDMLLVSFGSFFLSIALAYIIRAVLAYLVFPGIGMIVPAVDDFFTNQNREEMELFNGIAYEICLLVSFFISMFILTPFAENRKTVFGKIEKGEFITPLKGIVHFLKYDFESLFSTILSFSALNFLFGKTFGFAPFSILFRYFDNLEIILISAVLVFIAEFVCILPAQKHWLVDYYIGED